MDKQVPAALSCCAVTSPTQRVDPLGFRSVDFVEWLKSEGIMIHTAMNLGDYRHCTALLSCFRGKLCDQLMNRPGRPVTKGQPVYGLGDPAKVCSSFGKA